MTAISKAMCIIQRGIHAVGVGKVRENREQRFNFRGIDDALSAFAPLLTEAGVFVLPSYSDIVVSERPTKSGGITYNARLQASFFFVSAEDGSSLTAGPFYAEANDTQDKAISKATSVAYRNALFLTFCVPHEPAIGGDPDGIVEPESSPVDISGLADKIKDSQTEADLASLAQEIKNANLPAPALRNVRALWAKRRKEIAK